MTLAAKLTDKQKWQRLLSSLRYSLYVIFHPFDGFWDLSREKRGSLGAANIIVFLVLLVRLLSMQFTPFLFMNVYWPSVNIIQQCLAVLLPLLFFVAGNWGLTTLFEGKGTFKDVYIATCYALTPYVILQAAMILLANVITAKEGAFYYVLEGLSLGWSGVLIICGMMQTHDYSLGKTLLFTIMTLLAMVVIIFLLLLFFFARWRRHRLFRLPLQRSAVPSVLTKGESIHETTHPCAGRAGSDSSSGTLSADEIRHSSAL